MLLHARMIQNLRSLYFLFRRTWSQTMTLHCSKIVRVWIPLFAWNSLEYGHQLGTQSPPCYAKDRDGGSKLKCAFSWRADFLLWRGCWRDCRGCSEAAQTTRIAEQRLEMKDWVSECCHHHLVEEADTSANRSERSCKSSVRLRSISFNYKITDVKREAFNKSSSSPLSTPNFSYSLLDSLYLFSFQLA